LRETHELALTAPARLADRALRPLTPSLANGISRITAGGEFWTSCYQVRSPTKVRS